MYTPKKFKILRTEQFTEGIKLFRVKTNINPLPGGISFSFLYIQTKLWTIGIFIFMLKTERIILNSKK